MKIAVIGCGGIGGVVAGSLAARKQNVCCVELAEETLRALREKGVRVEGPRRSIHAAVRAFRSLTETGDRFDLAIVSVKSDALPPVFRDARKHLCEGGMVLTLQNGIEIIDLASRYPETRIAAGAVNAQMEEPARYRLTSAGGITVGNLTCASADDLFLLQNLFEPVITVDITSNTTGVLWSKLLVVCGVTGLGGASGLLLGQLLKLRVARMLFYRIVTEGVLVARARGVRFAAFRGGMNPEKFANLRGAYPLPVRRLLLTVIGMKYRQLKSSIHHSLDKGQKTEVDYLNGKILRLGEDAGISTPVNGEIVRVIKQIESGARSMGAENLLHISREAGACLPPRGQDS